MGSVLMASGARASTHGLTGCQLVGLAIKLLPVFGLLLVATTLEAGCDAIVRTGLQKDAVLVRMTLLALGGCVLFGYGVTLNLAPVDWGRLIGAYVASFFIVEQIINLIAFKTAPTPPIPIGGALILCSGAVIAFWRG